MKRETKIFINPKECTTINEFQSLLRVFCTLHDCDECPLFTVSGKCMRTPVMEAIDIIKNETYIETNIG